MADPEEEAVFGKPARRKAVHDIGETLDTLSVDEIDERIALLKAEIERLAQARASKTAVAAAAEAFFRR